jgi:hypothetical protein
MATIVKLPYKVGDVELTPSNNEVKLEIWAAHRHVYLFIVEYDVNGHGHGKYIRYRPDGVWAIIWQLLKAWWRA